MESNVYLGLRSIFWQLARAKSDEQLRDVVARMWDMAVNLEDGSVSDAEQALRAAQEALAPGAGARRERRGDQAPHRPAARGARQVPAGAGRAAAQESAAAGPAARSQCAHAAPAGSQEHDRPAGADGALRRQGRRETAAAGAAVDARQPADGPSGPADGRRRRRRHDVGARRARRHDPQAAAAARPHLPAGPGHAARPPARSARSARPAGAARPAGRPERRWAICRATSRRCAISSRS